jgi:hypothetical protein
MRGPFFTEEEKEPGTYLLTVFFYLPEETCTLKTLHKVQLGFFHELLLGLFLAYQGKGH